MDRYSWGNVARWAARILGLLYFAFISLLVFAHAFSPEGLPPIWRASLAEQLDTLALFLMVVGGIVGWKWEAVAALMILFGSTLWLLVERHLPWPSGLILVVGLLYAFAWWSVKSPFTPRSQAMR